MSFVVYQIKSPENRVYIGSTGEFSKRMREHRSAAKTNLLNNELYQDINKYGWNSFEKKVLRVCDTKKYSKICERYFILQMFGHVDLYNEILHLETNLIKKDIQRSEKIRRQKISEHMKINGSKFAKIGAEKRKGSEFKFKMIKKEDDSVVGVYNDKHEVAKMLGVRSNSVYRYIQGCRAHKKYRFERI